MKSRVEEQIFGIEMAATSTSCDQDVEKGAAPSAAAGDSSAMHQQQTQQDRNESLLLKLENERLRGELVMMQQQISRLEDFQKQHRIRLPPAKPNDGTHRRRSTTNIDKNSVILNFPVTLRPNPSSDEIISSQSNRSNGNNKDHQSVSTTDDRETEEPRFIDSHQSASGLHHRTSTTAGNTFPTKVSPTRITSVITDVTTTISAALCNKMQRSEMDDSSSSDLFYDEDDPLGEGRGLMIRDDRKESPKILNEENGGTRMALAIESTMAGNENNPNYHQMSFLHSLGDRAGWLIGLLIFQSLSSFILAKNEPLLKEHTVIFQFLTMLVGAGGNAGNQASVGVVRGIAIGTVNRSNARRVLMREFMMGVALSCIIGLAGFVRTLVFRVPMIETIAITSSLFFIVIISVAVGAALPLGMEAVGIDPAHSSTTIQVVMDITGVLITVNMCNLMLDSDFHDWLLLKLS